MPRMLLLCFIHGFKGSENTFHEFPYDLKREVARDLPDHHVESVIYPKFETQGELSQASNAFLDWLKGRVMELRKAHSEKPWPPNDRDVGVVLVAHSMGGFVASDSLFRALTERAEQKSEDALLFPYIQGIVTFDTPYNGLARSMFVYGAFSNYQKVSNVFNVMTALGAAAPAGFGRLASQHTATSATTATTPRSNPAWKTWQLVAVRTGAVGSIAAGGVAAYMHREAIMKGMKNMRNINKESIASGYRQSMETVGQGLAYVNRGSVGKSFAWLSDHFAFVGALMKPKELNRRLGRMGALEGVGFMDFYTSLGENGYWSGGYFVPERTFCAVPEEDHPANGIFNRFVVRDAADEIHAHMTMFQPQKNPGYERMTEEAGQFVKKCFLSEADIVDDPKFQEVSPEENEEDTKVEETLKDDNVEAAAEGETGGKAEDDGDGLPDESPIDIAAAASLVPLPEDGQGDIIENTGDDTNNNDIKRTYREYLFHIAQQTSAGAKSWWPSKMPAMPEVSMPSIPSMPKVPVVVSSRSRVSIPGMDIFGKKQASGDAEGDGVEKLTKEEGVTTEDVSASKKREDRVSNAWEQKADPASAEKGREQVQQCS